jgi:uncharacterized coiled-coil protein SlyX
VTDRYPSTLPPGAQGEPFLPGPTIDDDSTPGFDEYRWSQLVEENKRIISVLGAMKRRLDELEAQANLVAELEGKLTALVMRLDMHTERHREVVVRLEALEGERTADAVVVLDERLRAIEAKDAPPPKPVDEVNEQIVAFLESVPDVKLTAISIRENLGIDAKYIHDRCKTLVRNNRIRMYTEANRHPFYQALPKAEPAVDSPA